MITIDEARELVNTADIPFPPTWKEQMVKIVDDSIRNISKTGRKCATIQGKVTDNMTYRNFHLTPGQFSEISAMIKANGFKVEEYFKIRFDGQPLTIDISW